MAATLPTSESELGHIFRAAEGHVADTPENRELLLGIANDPNAFLSTDRYGIKWYARVQSDGTQVWAQVRKDKIINAGVNQTVRVVNKETGLRRL